MTRAPFHEQALLSGEDGTHVSVDRHLCAIIGSLWDLGLKTHSSCERDFILWRGRRITSEYAYVGFGSCDDAATFVKLAVKSDPGLRESAIDQAVSARPGFGDGYRSGASPDRYTLLACTIEWAYSSEVWRADRGLDHIDITTFVAFPASLIEFLGGALSQIGS
jgi:hypothetical protein